MATLTFYTKPARTPTRGFLERHIDEAHVLDFVSVASQVFTPRPRLATKRGVVFGFDKAYAAAGIR